MVERLVVFASGNKVTYDDLPVYLHKEERNQIQAVRYLDLCRKALIYHMEKYGISRERCEGVERVNHHCRQSPVGVPLRFRGRASGYG
jgi:hypothetical protein